MYILQITNNYYISEVYKNLFESLRSHLTKIKVIVPLLKSDLNKFSKESSEDLRPLFLGTEQTFGNILNTQEYFKYLKECNWLSQIDLVHAHFLLADGLVARKIKKKYGIPYVVSVRTSCTLILMRKFKLHDYISALLVLLNADKVVFQSLVPKNKTISLLPFLIKNKIKNKSIILSNGINEFWLKNIYNVSKELNTDKLTIITAAEIDSNKNFRTTVKVILSLIKKGYNIEYKIAGKIKDQTIYNEIIKNEFVKYLGLLTKEQLLLEYRASDFFIMVSHHETFGMVYAEAMTQGLPIIYSKGEGFDNQFIEGTVGYHCSSTSEEDIENTIMKLIQHYQVLSLNTIKYVKKYNWQDISKSYIDIYANIINKNNLS